MVQDAAGNTYVLPEGGTGAYYVALQAGPIRSITLDSINDLSNLGVDGDRPVDNFVAPDGVVDGTSGDDTMSLGYIDAAGDVIDNSGNTIVGGVGADTIQGGTGNDTIFGGGTEAVDPLLFVNQGLDTDLSGYAIGGTGVIAHNVSGTDGNALFRGNPGQTGTLTQTMTDLTAGAAYEISSLLGPRGNTANFPENTVDFTITVDGVVFASGVIGNGTGTANPTFEFIATDSDAEIVVTFVSTGPGTGAGFGQASVFNITATEVVDVGDIIDGGAGDDVIDGEDGNDTIDGGVDDDSITGGDGDDNLTGGSGDDVFIYATGDDGDTITDFNAGNTGGLNDGDSTNNDFIDLSGRYDQIRELWADQNDDGILNQSNTLDTKGNAVDYSDNDQFGVGDSITFTGAAGDNSFFTVENTAVACFAPGTMIDTPTGPRNIEALSDGDLVLTRDNGPQMIRWIHEDTHAIDGEEDYPILIKAGALGAGLSASDLVVSPQHRILVGEAGQLEHLFDAPTLVPAKSLTTLPGIREMRGKTNITWWHFAFDNHEVVAANGAETESLLLGKMVFMGLPKAERDALLMSFNVDRANAGALNGAPARPLLNAGKARRILLENEAALTPGLMRHLHKADDAFVH